MEMMGMWYFFAGFGVTLVALVVIEDGLRSGA
jgi:hypothetical protein